MPILQETRNWSIEIWGELGRKETSQHCERLSNEKLNCQTQGSGSRQKKDKICFGHGLHSFCSNMFCFWFLKYFQVLIFAERRINEQFGKKHWLKIRSVCLFIRSISWFVKYFLQGNVYWQGSQYINPCPVHVYYFLRWSAVALTGTSAKQ